VHGDAALAPDGARTLDSTRAVLEEQITIVAVAARHEKNP